MRAVCHRQGFARSESKIPSFRPSADTAQGLFRGQGQGLALREFGDMTKKTSGRTAFILAIGLLAGFAVPSRAADTSPSDNVGITAPTNPSAPQAAPAGQQAGADQLSESDRAARPDDVKTPVVVTQTEAPAPGANLVVAGSQNATWDETSLIGKVFIAFGALLTLASAARMFMA